MYIEFSPFFPLFLTSENSVWKETSKSHLKEKNFKWGGSYMSRMSLTTVFPTWKAWGSQIFARLTPKEPFVFDLVRLAANHVDRQRVL